MVYLIVVGFIYFYSCVRTILAIDLYQVTRAKGLYFRVEKSTLVTILHYIQNF